MNFDFDAFLSQFLFAPVSVRQGCRSVVGYRKQRPRLRLGHAETDTAHSTGTQSGNLKEAIEGEAEAAQALMAKGGSILAPAASTEVPAEVPATEETPPTRVKVPRPRVQVMRA